MVLGARTDPFLSYRFLVEIENLVVAGFSEVSGLQVEVDVQDYQEGGLNAYVHKLAGPARYPSNLSLKRGLTRGDMLWNWHQEVTRGIIKRKNGSIVLLDSTGQEQWRWNFVEAFPVRWIGPGLRAGAAEVAVETLELVHRGITKAT
jgi:phage tail-like protein